MLAAAYEGFEVKVWNASSAALIRTLDFPNNYVENVVYSSDGKKIVGQSKHGYIRVWDVESWKLIDKGIGWLLKSFPIDKTPIVCTYETGVGERFMNPLTKNIVFTVPLEPSELMPEQYFYEASVISYSSDSKYFAKGSGYGWIAVWDIERQEMANVLSGHESFQGDGAVDGIYDLEFAPYEYLLASTGIDGTVRLWNAETGKSLWSVDLGQSISSLAFSPDGRYLIAGDFTGSVYVWAISE